MKYTLFFFSGLLSFHLGSAQTTTIASGNWNTAANWSTGNVPGNGTTTIVNHAMTMDGNLSPSGNYTINAPVTDLSGGSNYNLTVGAGGNLDINANFTAEGVLNMNGGLFNGAELVIRSGDTLFIGYPGSTATSTINSYSDLYIEAGGVLIVYGNVDVESNGNIFCDGEILIDGNYHGETGSFLFWEFPSEVTGSGTITTTGTITTDGSSEVFGSTGNCSTGPCSSTGNPCGITNTISNAQTICAGVTPADLTGSNPGGTTHQWQQSTTSPFTGFQNISGATNRNLTFSSAVNVTTWYRRISTVTSSSCVSTSSSVKVTVNPSPGAASVSISSTTTTFCSGTSVSFTATPVNGGGAPSYQWRRTRAGVTSNVSTANPYTTTTHQDGDIVFCVMTSNALCVTGSPATSNSVPLTVISGGGSWSGVTNSNWQTNSNWCSGARPTAATNVTINGGTLNDPLISTNNAVCNNLTLNSGAVLTVDGRNLTVSGNLVINSGGSLVINSNTVTVNGSITVNSGGNINITSPGALSARGNIINNGTLSGTGTATLNGTAVQNLSGTGFYGNVTLNNTLGCIATSAVTISGHITLTTGAFTSNGNLSIDLNTGSIARTGTGSIVGNITVFKSAYSGRYHYLSSPLMTGMTVMQLNDDVEIKSGSYSNFYYYDETVPSPIDLVGWTPINGLGLPLDVMKGYALFFEGPATIDMTGTYVHGAVPTNVTLTNTLSADVSVDGWNLVGNPYPSTLDWDAAGWTKTGIGNAIYYWDPVNDRYASYIGGIGTNGGTRYIPSMQAFWVHVTASGGTGTFGMNNNVRTTTANPTLWRTAGAENILKLTASSGGYSDETVIRLTEDASENFDDYADAYKLSNEENTPNLYTEFGADRYSINSLPDSILEKTVPVKLKAGFTGSYTFTAEEIGSFGNAYDILFEDRLLGVNQDLRSNPSYVGEVIQGDTSARFYLTFKKAAVSPVVSGIDIQPSVSLRTAENNVHIKFNNETSTTASIVISSSIGQVKYSSENVDIRSGELIIKLPSGEQGIYIVKVTTDSQNHSGKVYLNR